MTNLLIKENLEINLRGGVFLELIPLVETIIKIKQLSLFLENNVKLQFQFSIANSF